MDDHPEPRDPAAPSPLREVVSVMAKLGFIGFGGPAAHLALMREEAVVNRDWVSEQEFLDLVGAASALPGPTSTQVSMLLGKRRGGWAGLVIGGSCFIIPAMLIVLGLAVAYEHWGTTVAGSGLLYGIKPVVIAIVAQALWSLSRTAVRGRVLLGLGAASAFALYLANGNALLALLAVAVVVMLADNRGNFGSAVPALVPIAAVGGSGPGRHAPKIVEIFLEFLKLGCVVFGERLCAPRLSPSRSRHRLPLAHDASAARRRRGRPVHARTGVHDRDLRRLPGRRFRRRAPRDTGNLPAFLRHDDGAGAARTAAAGDPRGPARRWTGSMPRRSVSWRGWESIWAGVR